MIKLVRGNSIGQLLNLLKNQGIDDWALVALFFCALFRVIVLFRNDHLFSRH